MEHIDYVTEAKKKERREKENKKKREKSAEISASIEHGQCFPLVVWGSR